jgi:nitrile hydratase
MMSSDTHDHDHGSHGMYDVDPTHYHPPQPDLEDSPLTRHQVMQIAVTELLIEKGVFTAEEMRRAIELMDSISPARGAKLVARAWVDEAFKCRLIANSAEAAVELGMDIGPIPILVMENTPAAHNVIVCTLCSCYPRMLLGLPPDWYKSRNYRSRVVKDPRAVLAEFGTEIPDDVTIRVHDSNADMRYMVLPMRPPGTEDMTEEQLAELVTRDCLIGVTVPRAPGATALGRAVLGG